MIKDGKIGPIVDMVFPMEQAADAHRLVETEQRLGAIVIAIGGDADDARDEHSCSTASFPP